MQSCYNPDSWWTLHAQTQGDVMAKRKGFGGKKAAPFRKGGKPRKPGTVHKQPRTKTGKFAHK